MDHQTGGKWIIHGPKHDEENQLLGLELTVACYRYATPFLFNVATVVLLPY